MTIATGRDTDQQRFLSVKEAAAFLGVGTTFIYEQVYSGALRSFKLGRVHRIKLSDLERFAESREYVPGETA